ncbi:MAG: S53 family peptidase, partial [Terracidiphilus sp.]
MKTMIPSLPHRRLRMAAATAALVLSAAVLAAQTPLARIQFQIDSSHLSPIPGSQNALARVATDLGRMPANTPINGITLRFNRSAQQEAALDALIQAQQNPASPLYHKWLTPDQFAAQFGMAQSDIDTVESWLRQQGFTVNDVNRSHTEIHFSGTTGQVETAFATEMHFFEVNGQKHFAPSTALSVPAAIAGVVSDIHNLSDFRPHADHIIPRRTFTSGQTGNVFFAPPDIATTYDIQALYTEGVKGDGQTIAIMGQSAIALSDIEAFQNASNLSVKDPNLVLVPGTGTNTVSSGDESESDLDLEWSGAMAPGANIVFVYVGNNQDYSTFDAANWAVDEGIGNIISMSYSVCELDPYVTSSYIDSQEAIYKQAAAQGQTVLAASGDSGSTACYGDTNITSTATQESLAVNYPASSAYVTAVGGTEIASEFSSGGSSVSQYWSSNGSNDVLSSALSYIPEVAWNDDALAVTSGATCSATSSCLSSSGGGASTFIAQPSWQSDYFKTTGEANPSSSHRLLPDISFYASPDQPGYLYCTSDQSSWGQSQTGSCGSGFRASTSDASLTVAGGTSFGTPIFAGMVALLNQFGKYTTGAGEINATLYTQAAVSATYSAAFHDVTTGNNYCQVPENCNAQSNYGYAAGTGYDEVTGLGSVNLAKLASYWPAASAGEAALIGTNVSVSPANITPLVGQNDIFTITVTADGGNPVTTGTVNLQINGGTSCGGLSGSPDCGGSTVTNQ